ncbi:glycosyltransferase family 4 protein [Paenibacillus tarimensis]|uniref:glycosyltransferase family 4 protein n=1 Tax=Paenibacillus tarimensis TaxID=416012 RepID=UPI001F2A2A01|nr:glycosyltransferase family 4 protein [Paenibacillus tarimensis]MCF2943588.1 glycosyltransferase family 4 protein [Paenibacillus tarimensis]
MNQSKNVLFVFYVPSGGVETLNRQRVAALKRYNISGHCLYYQKTRDTLNPHGGPVFIGRDPGRIKDILEKGRYRAIVVVSDYSVLPLFRSLGYRGKLILEIQGLGPKDRAREFLTSAMPAVKAHADALLNPRTPHIVQLMSELYPSMPQFSFNNCFDTAAFSYKKLNKHPRPIIAWTGRIVDNKNWREFLHIGRQIINRINPETQLYMFEDPSLADPAERRQFEHLINRLRLYNNLHLLKNIRNERMMDFFSIIGDSGGFYCSTSKVEGAPYSVLEALSCRCPILTTDSDGVRSSVIHNKTGKYYAIGNIRHAVQEAAELMTNLPLREAIRTSGQNHVKLNFNPELYSRNFIRMLTSLGVRM